MKKKIFKIIGIILLIVIALFLIHTFRNYVIISDLQNKIAKYVNSTNYRTKSVTSESDGTIITMDYYKKDNKEVVFMERNLNGEISKISIYNNGERKDTFYDNKEGKTVQLGTDNFMSINIYNFLETDNNWQTLFGSICSNIKSTNCDGKDCYIIKGFLSSMTLSSTSVETYIEKDTGLYFKTVDGENISTREYEFDKVDDSIFVEPDIGLYTIKEK